jgi:hypothetical protein
MRSDGFDAVRAAHHAGVEPREEALAGSARGEGSSVAEESLKDGKGELQNPT